jgi:hypothetical protein
MRLSRTLSPVLLVLLIAGCGMAHAVTLTERFEQSYPVTAGGTVSVGNVNGEVVVEAWDRDTVAVEAVKEARAGSQDVAREALQKIRIEVNALANGVAFKTHMPEHNGVGIVDWLTGNGVQAKVDYHLHVPRRLELSVDNTNGRVSVTGTAGKARIGTTNGAIELEHAEGNLRAETTNGSLRLLDLAGSVRAETTNGGIHAQLSRVEGDLSFETTNGSISLQLPSSVRASVDASTSNGTVHSDFEVSGGKTGRHHLHGDINGGGGKLVLSTTNGGIRISSGS